jgi:hypothetical protein
MKSSIKLLINPRINLKQFDHYSSVLILINLYFSYPWEFLKQLIGYRLEQVRG